jgi:hypothetical protein
MPCPYPIDITDVKGGKAPNFLNGYTEKNNIPNRATVDFVLENVNKKQTSRYCYLQWSTFKLKYS